MAELTTFATYYEYVKAQKRSDKKKSTHKCGATPEEAGLICDHLKKHRQEPEMGLCHGARFGMEIDMFRECIPNLYIIGTDLFPKKKRSVKKWDFHDQRKRWIGRFDFVYSNCLDHSHSPDVCVSVWLRQLKDSGLLFVQWTPYHMGINWGDCFGATLHEYIDIFNKAGVVTDLIVCDKLRILIVARKRTKDEIVW